MVVEATNAAAHAAEATDAVGGIGALGLNVKIFIAQLLNFGIVLLVLWKFAYKPIVAMLEKREQMVKKSVEDAKSVDGRLKKIEEERVTMLAETRNEAKKMIEDAATGGEARRKEMTDRAKEEVAKVVTEGKAQLQAEREASVRQMRAEIADIAVAAAKKILEEGVDQRKAESLAEEAVRKMTKKEKE